MSRRFDLPKGVVAYACDLFQKGQPQLLLKIKMNNSGKQSSSSKEAIAALFTKSNTKNNASATDNVPPLASATISQFAISNKTAPTSTTSFAAAKKPSAATQQLGMATTTSATAAALMVAKEEQRLYILRNTLELEDQARRSMMLRNASLFHQPFLSTAPFLPTSSRGTMLSSTSPGTPTSRLLELALLREAMSTQFCR
jgi:D-Tyr-tRNAtyr deacylase